MIICGLKLTHDGSIALIEDNKLLFSIELEKLENNPRYTSIEDTALIRQILRQQGVSLKDIDAFAIDGWGGYDADALAIQPRLEIGKEYNTLSAVNGDEAYHLGIAQYAEKALNQDVLQGWDFKGLRIGENAYAYSSYMHVTGHILGAYCTSPFARRNESAYVLVWDGGMYPRLYYFDCQTGRVENFGPIFLLIGNVLTIFSQHFGPFKVAGGFAKDDLSIAGKVMAYIALGKERSELFACFDRIYNENYEKPMGFANVFAREFKQEIAGKGYSDEDILTSFHAYIEGLLVSKLEKKLSRYARKHKNLCIAGGCGLNIKWNSGIRDSGIFDEVYVPPFPNDSGSAIGAACARMVQGARRFALDWQVYSGPGIIKNSPAPGWAAREGTVRELAALIHETNEPVVLLNGRAELGPRALGNRSIVGAATSGKMKDILNQIKVREDYRPVSPICLEDQAARIFSPGTRDPFMLFDHYLRPEWEGRIPAIRHLDGTARLQTVARAENPFLWELLSEYARVSGIPVLCNTSANHKGSGFFPDVASATGWAGVNYVWCENTLYERKEKILFN